MTATCFVRSANYFSTWMGDQVRIPRVVIPFSFLFLFLFQGDRTAELPSLCNVVSSIYPLFAPHFAMTVFMCIYFNKQRDMSFEFSSILSTLDLSKHFIMAWINRKFIQLVNFVTFGVFFFVFFGNWVWLNLYERALSGNELFSLKRLSIDNNYYR